MALDILRLAPIDMLQIVARVRYSAQRPVRR
jgi:hypothetical protein